MKLYGQKFLVPARDVKISNPAKWPWKPAHPEWLKDLSIFDGKHSFLIHKVKRGTRFTLLIGRNTIQTGLLIEALKRRGASFVAIDWDEFIYEGKLSCPLKAGAKKILSFRGKFIDLSHVKKVFYTEPMTLEALTHDSYKFNSAQILFLNRWAEVLRNLYSLTPKALWYPAMPRHLQRGAQRKIAEIMTAQRMSLLVPETLLTMNAMEARKFVKKHKGHVIFRDFGPRVVTEKGKTKVFKVDFVNPKARDWKFIAETPCVFQQFIKKDFDVRTVVIGKKVLTCRIDSQKNSKTKMDWRRYDTGDVPYKIHKLPADVNRKLLKMAGLSGLKFASFDLVAHKGKYYFLEMNRPGAWFFVEALSGLPISETLAKELS